MMQVATAAKRASCKQRLLERTPFAALPVCHGAQRIWTIRDDRPEECFSVLTESGRYEMHRSMNGPRVWVECLLMNLCSRFTCTGPQCVWQPEGVQQWVAVTFVQQPPQREYDQGPAGVLSASDGPVAGQLSGSGPSLARPRVTQLQCCVHVDAGHVDRAVLKLKVANTLLAAKA